MTAQHQPQAVNEAILFVAEHAGAHRSQPLTDAPVVGIAGDLFGFEFGEDPRGGDTLAMPSADAVWLATPDEARHWLATSLDEAQ